MVTVGVLEGVAVTVGILVGVAVTVGILVGVAVTVGILVRVVVTVGVLVVVGVTGMVAVAVRMAAIDEVIRLSVTDPPGKLVDVTSRSMTPLPRVAPPSTFSVTVPPGPTVPVSFRIFTALSGYRTARHVPLFRGLFVVSAMLKATVRAMPCSRVIAVVVGVIAGIPPEGLMDSVRGGVLRMYDTPARRAFVVDANESDVTLADVPDATAPFVAFNVIRTTLKYPVAPVPVAPVNLPSVMSMTPPALSDHQSSCCGKGFGVPATYSSVLTCNFFLSNKR